MQGKVSNLIKIFKKVIDNETKMCYYEQKLTNTKHKIITKSISDTREGVYYEKSKIQFQKVYKVFIG